MLNLLSVGWMVAKGWECNFRGAPPRCDLVYHTQPLGSHLLQNNLCFLNIKFLSVDTPLPLLKSPVPLSAFTHISPTSDLWHAHLGHVGGDAATHVDRFANGADVDSIERWWSAQGRSSLKRREKESCSVTSVCWQATIILVYTCR